MLHQSQLLIRYCEKRLKDPSYEPLTKLGALLQNKILFLAGIYYLDQKDYIEAEIYFKKTGAYRHLISVYQKQGLYSKAITLAEEKKYYKQGASLCMHIHNYKKAASFYSHFKPLQAAKLYKKNHFFYEAGICYLKAYHVLSAIDCFKACKDPHKRQSGLKQVEEFALVLYFSKDYDTALKIFLHLDDYYSALDCAVQMKEDTLITVIRLLIASDEAEKNDYILAAQCVENFVPDKAIYYYALGHAYSDVIRLLVEEGEYHKAINVCLLQNDLSTAYEIAAEFEPSLISS